MKNPTEADYRNWADELGRLEDEIVKIQDEKKAVYARIRTAWNAQIALAMKQAMRLLRMGKEERNRFAETDARIRVIIHLLERAVPVPASPPVVHDPISQPASTAPCSTDSAAMPAAKTGARAQTSYVDLSQMTELDIPLVEEHHRSRAAA